ncbi:RagB/SusD family nutrient uptake outer membrane protein [Prolixibacteraceae bacterium JC049]|nr:RagB/SusD family nutrient uptake outer membrane protein [Prolixibacteraceae bacterium JC049]
MKAIFKYIFISLIAINLFGCQELVREDFNQIYPENFFQNENDVKNATTAMYRLFHMNSYGGGGVYSFGRDGYNIFTEVTTDIMDCQWGDGGSWATFNTHRWTAENTKGTDKIYWKYNWLSKGEQIIKNIKESTVSDDVKTRYIAQVEGLQGWLAFVLYDLYGGVPIASAEVLDNFNEEVYLERYTKEQMIKYIEDKLNAAAASLPVKVAAADWGRLTKGAVKTILMKLYLHEKNWVKVEELCREVMKPEYGYDLENKYKDIFSIDNEINDEVILPIPCNPDDFKNGWAAHVLPYNFPYENSAAQKWSGYRMEWGFYHTYEAGDARLETIAAEYKGTDGVTYNEQNPAAHLAKGALPIKYGVDPNHVGHGAGNDFPVYRLADVILCLAEAINNQNGPTDEAYALVNRVRNRAELGNLQTGLSKEAFNDAILLERGHELYCEGHRRQDLIRHGKYVELAKLKPENLAADYKVLFPIPNGAITESKGAVKQNPGY